jgi:hypothetical protein
MRARASVAGVLLALLAGSGTAAAATPPLVVVASDGATQMLAGDELGNLCVGVRTQRDTSRSCERDALGVVDLGGAEAGVRYVAAGVAASAAIVEVRRAGQLLVSGPTVAGEAYKGKRAGKVRFALLRLPDNAREDGLRVRVLDAAGSLVAVLATNAVKELVVARGRLLAGRSGGVEWSIEANQVSELEPTVVDLGHERVSECALTRVRYGAKTARSSPCSGPAPFDSLEIFSSGLIAKTDELCAPEFRLLHGVVAATGVSVLLGDGRTRSARTAAFGDGRVVYALVIPRDAAVRNITFGGAAARVLALGMAPLHVVCPNLDDQAGLLDGPDGAAQLASLIAHPPPLTPAGPVTTLAGSGARVADGPGDTLCLAVAGRPFSAFGCQVVAPAFEDLAGAVDDFTDPRAFALALPARVAAIRIGAPAGPGLREIPTVPGDGYAGAYAGRVRFAAGKATAASQLDNIDLLDGAGTVLHRERSTPNRVGSGSAPRATDRRRLAGRPGRPSLWQTTYRGPYRCVALTSGPHPPSGAACQDMRSRSTVLLAAPCATHRLTVAVTPGAGTRVIAVTGGSGSRAIPLRHGAGLLTLASTRSLRSLSFVRRGRATRVRIGAPAGARQCGWSAAPQVDAG